MQSYLDNDETLRWSDARDRNIESKCNFYFENETFRCSDAQYRTIESVVQFYFENETLQCSDARVKAYPEPILVGAQNYLTPELSALGPDKAGILDLIAISMFKLP